MKRSYKFLVDTKCTSSSRGIDMRTHFVISSLRSTVLKFTKKVIQSHADLLRDYFGHSVRNLGSQVETINIFSVVSGNLCERLLRIMMMYC